MNHWKKLCNKLKKLSKLHWVLILAIWLLAFSNQIAWAETSYNIEATYSPEHHMLEGQVTVQFTNTTQQPLKEVFFQLRANRQLNLMVREATNKDGLVLPSDFYKYPYLNRQKHDKTLFQVFLNQPLEAGQKTELILRYTLQHIPITNQSAFLLNDFNQEGTGPWYPKLADLTADGWQTTELAMADYQIALTIPTGLTPVAGVPAQDVSKPFNAQRVYRFKAERFHTFDLAIIPDSLTRNSTLSGFQLTYFYPSKLQSWSADVMEVASQILTFYQQRYGFFAGSHLTLVAGEDKKLNSLNGHNIIVLDNHFSQLENKLGITELSQTLAYAIAQQYWGGRVLASGQELPWLNQGLAMYAASQYMAKRQLPFSKAVLLGQAYIDTASQGWDTSLTTPLEDLAYMPFNSFKVLAQGKGYTFIKMLEQLLGKTVVQQIEERLQKKYLFASPPPNALQFEAEESSQKELSWFFNQWQSGATLDYAIQSIEVNQHEGQYQANITVLRLGKISMPITIDIILDNGEHMFRLWNGDKLSERLTFTVPTNIKEIRLDPAHILPDVNRQNNIMLNKRP